MKQRHATVVYFSFTQQAERVAEATQNALQAEGWQTSALRIHMEDRRYPLRLPLDRPWRFLLRLLIPQLLHRTAAIRLDHPVPASTDFVMLISPTWWFNPAMPIVSFMRSPAAAALLDQRPFAVMTVCRSSWRGNLRWLRRQGQRLGGLFRGHLGFQFLGNELQSAMTFLRHVQQRGLPERSWGLRLHRYGPPEESFERIPEFISTVVPGADGD